MLAAGSALVAGMAISQEDKDMLSIEVTRPFFYQRELQKVGSKIDVPPVFAQELIAAKKAKAAAVEKPSAPQAKGKPEAKTEEANHARQ